MTFRNLLSLLFLGALLISSGASAGTLYKSVDSDGKVTFSDRPPTTGKVVKTFAELPSTPIPESVLRARQELQKSPQVQQPAPQPQRTGVHLYSAQWCGYCRQAKAYLAEKNIPYQDHDIDTSSGNVAFTQAGGGGGIPLIVWQGQKVRGFSREGYDALFSRSK
jgi:glutaredoxin